MEYMTTKLQAVKSYPTYQFHAFTASGRLSAEDVFKICVLETLRWLRLRMNNYDSIPDELKAPDPENYADSSEDELNSFNINAGANMDCTFIRSRGVWSFRISEPDTGENLGTETERLPVNGRTFQTEISFLKCTDNVEVGVRTTCSEPADCNAPCAVFRPAVVKALADDPDIGFAAEGFRLNGRPLTITSQNEMRNFERLFFSGSFNMPIAVVTDSGYEKKVPAAMTAPDTKKLSYKGFGHGSYTSALTADVSKVEIERTAVGAPREKAENTGKTEPLSEVRDAEVKMPVLDYEKLAEKTVCFAAVCYIPEKYFSTFRNKTGIEIGFNEVIVFLQGNETERLCYTSATMESIAERLKNDLRNMLKRSSFSYGDILFYSDARLADLREQRHENISLEERLNIYKQENSELAAHNRELQQQNTDLMLNAGNIRLMQKQLSSLQREREALDILIENLREQSRQKEDSYRRAADIVGFYRTKARDAAGFPTEKDKVCSWARENFSDNIIIAHRAEAALRKYSGALDTAILCDGIYYLDAYAKHRQGRLSSSILKMYAEDYNWSVSGCGSGALRVHRDDYEVTVDGKKYLLDAHIKYGVNSKVLIRIYFCWDEEAEKVVIGYMPEHLATAAQST